MAQMATFSLNTCKPGLIMIMIVLVANRSNEWDSRKTAPSS